MTGQLAKVRDALASEVAVVIDDRDQMALADQEAENEDISDPGTAVERVQVAKRVWSIYDSNPILVSPHFCRFVYVRSTIIKGKKPR